MAERAYIHSHFFSKGRLVLLSGAVALLLFILTLLAFTASLNNGFVWDDIQYVAQNQRIRSLDFHALAGMCTTYYQSNWHPLTWISHAVDYHLFGLNPSGHHLSSIILHALNCVLVFFLVIKLVVVVEERKTHGRQPMPSHVLIAYCLLSGVVTTLLFSLHPLRVE